MKILYFCLAVFCALLLTAPMAVIVWYEYNLWSIAVYISMLLALPVCSAFHELGHMLFGAILKIKAVPHFSLFGSSFCDVIPKTHKNLRSKLIVTALGGLIINAIFIFLGYLPSFTPVPVWLCVFLPASIYLFVLNALPAEYAEGRSDGQICLELIGNTDVAEVMLAVLTVQAQIAEGTPIKDVNKRLLFSLPQICEDEPAFISLLELRAKYCKAVGDEINAESYMRRFEYLKKEYMD